MLEIESCVSFDILIGRGKQPLDKLDQDGPSQVIVIRSKLGPELMDSTRIVTVPEGNDAVSVFVVQSLHVAPPTPLNGIVASSAPLMMSIHGLL